MPANVYVKTVKYRSLGGADMESIKKVSKLKQIFSKKKGNQEDSDYNISDKNLLNYYSSFTLFHPDIIIIFSKDYEIISIDNNKIFPLLGKPIKQMEDLKAIFTIETYKLLSRSFSLAVNGSPQKCKIDIKNKNNENLSFSLTFVPILIEDIVEGVYLTALDVTNQILLTDKLRSNENHLKQAQQIAKIGSWEYLIEDDHLFCSDNFYHIFGLEPNIYMHMDDPYKLVHPQDYEQAYAKIKEAVSRYLSI